MVSTWLDTAVFVLCLIVAVPYLLGPVLIFFTLCYRIPPEVVVIDPAQHPFPHELRQYFSSAHVDLTRLGFELLGTVLLPSLVPNVQALFNLYLNRENNDMAMSVFTLATAGGSETVKSKHVEFCTNFSDGVMVQTNNSAELSAFKLQPKEVTAQFWNIQNLDRLYQLHRFLLDKHRGTGHAICLYESQFGGDIAAYTAGEVISRSLLAQVDTGFMAPTSNGLRTTVKGAIIMTWQELWPLKAIRRRRRLHEAEQILNEMGGVLK
ncbi:MAG: hypothetical protein JXM70_23755 [Pirellulales bacterium]|nr:hypothetical protein [Pirellulales bacterium]